MLRLGVARGAVMVRGAEVLRWRTGVAACIGPRVDKPLVMATNIGSRRVIVAADKAAQALGLRLGLTVAHAQALVPELHVAESTPEADEEGLARLATWCMRYSPLVAADQPN